MIVLWFVEALFAVVRWFVGLLPSWTWPSWLDGSSTSGSTLGGYAHTIGAALGDVSSWVPLSIVGGCLTAIVAALGVSVAVRVVRMVASFLSGGGGGT